MRAAGDIHREAAQNGAGEDCRLSGGGGGGGESEVFPESRERGRELMMGMELDMNVRV